MTWNQINDWFDSFHDEYIEGKKPIRGRTFGGAHIEIWHDDEIVVVVHDPHLRGTDGEQKAADFVKGLWDGNKNVRAEINLERFQRIINGQDKLTDDDWSWDDE